VAGVGGSNTLEAAKTAALLRVGLHQERARVVDTYTGAVTAVTCDFAPYQ
jgi:hypothetical protein